MGPSLTIVGWQQCNGHPQAREGLATQDMKQIKKGDN
jgi:hypothetical protein